MIPLQRRTQPVAHTQERVDGAINHRYGPVTAGTRQAGGIVKAWLYQHGRQVPFVRINAAYMAGTTVDISVEDARQLRDGLDALLGKAGNG